MRIKKRLAVVALLAAAALQGCGGLAGIIPQTYVVAYTVTASGGATVTLLQYTNENGATITINNPALPWSTTVSMQSGASVLIRVKGNMANAATDNVHVLANCIGIGTSQTIDRTYSQNSAYDQTANLTLN